MTTDQVTDQVESYKIRLEMAQERRRNSKSEAEKKDLDAEIEWWKSRIATARSAK